ncbi:uncharacterized protein ACOB8E_004707 isoform 1-T1 [Sarcophilus harrisii]
MVLPADSSCCLRTRHGGRLEKDLDYSFAVLPHGVSRKQEWGIQKIWGQYNMTGYQDEKTKAPRGWLTFPMATQLKLPAEEGTLKESLHMFCKTSREVFLQD